MKKIGFIVFLSALVIGSVFSLKSGFESFHINFGGKSVRGSGNIGSETRNAADFTKIQTGGAINVEVSAQKDFSVAVEGDDNLLQFIKTETNGDTLKIYTEGKINPKSRITVKISMPAIDEAEVSGASNAVISNVKSESLKLEAGGASKITVDGTATNLESDASGASGIYAGSLNVENADVEASGASKIVVSANNELKADASGASSIYYTGEPKNLVSKSSGASSIKKK
ncbi:MAG: head GIN domain-containing protein [Pyrinomonadaceae bacterium]